MGKGGKRQKKGIKNPKKQTRDEYSSDEDMDDEVDAFHKQRDIIPLDVDGDVGSSDEDNVHPVFDVEEEDDDEDDDDDDDDAEDDGNDDGSKIAKQQKYLRQKFGGVDDEMPEDEEDEEEKKASWGRAKSNYYESDVKDYEIQSEDDEAPVEEEAEVVRLQEDRAKNLSLADHGLEDIDEDKSDSDEEPPLEDLVKGKGSSKSSSAKKTEEDMDTTYEEVKKDLSALSREEQMDVVYSSAPELVGLLSELNDAHDQLEGKVNPLLSKVKRSGNINKEGLHYLEVKQLLLLSYCQTISFYLLLKSEGHPVRDHPVIARLVEIKTLLDKMKQLDENLPADIEEILNQSEEPLKQSEAVASEFDKMEDHKPTSVLAKPYEATELVKSNLSKGYKIKEEKTKRKNDEVGKQSMEMLKIRAELEEKLKEKGIFSSIVSKSDKAQNHLAQRRKLESFDDFDDEVIDKDVATRGLRNALPGKRLGHFSMQVKKPKVISGDDDLPKRDDIGERRRKHELRVLGKAGMDTMNDDDEDHEGASQSDGVESGEDIYKKTKRQRDEKILTKLQKYQTIPTYLATKEENEPEGGKRHITNQMEKNRGLTPKRKKLLKNPRKKYRVKHKEKVMRRKGQVRDVKKPTGPYGGEESGINARISRSVRFKN